MSTSPIQPPPSVDDLLGLGTSNRVGNVDFATRLVPVPSLVPPVVEDERPATPPSSLAQRRPVSVPVPVLVLDDDLEDQVQDEADPEPEPAPVAPRSRPKATRKPAKPAVRRKPEPEPEPEPEPTMALPPSEAHAGPMILPVAQLDPFAVDSSRVDQTRTSRIPIEREPEPTPAPAPPVAPTTSRARDDGYLGLSVQQVADSAIERLLEAENATLRHLAAVEAEAARRAEMLTAQAELDAELIRITARREAHAIISAARVQAGAPSQNNRDSRELSEIGDAVSRFAESIEASIAPLRPNLQGDLS